MPNKIKPYITITGAPSDRPFSTLSEIKTAMINTGSHFWDKDAMRFFNSRASGNVYPTPFGTFFVTSERQDYTTARRYTVRFIAATEVQTVYTSPDGTEYPMAHDRLDLVDTSADAFQRFASASGAHNAAANLRAEMIREGARHA